MKQRLKNYQKPLQLALKSDQKPGTQCTTYQKMEFDHGLPLSKQGKENFQSTSIAIEFNLIDPFNCRT